MSDEFVMTFIGYVIGAVVVGLIARKSEIRHSGIVMGVFWPVVVLIGVFGVFIYSGGIISEVFSEFGNKYLFKDRDEE